jgi:hypothetical protein
VNKIAGAGQLVQDCQERTAGTRKPGKETRDTTAGTGQPKKTVGIVHLGQ